MNLLVVILTLTSRRSELNIPPFSMKKLDTIRERVLEYFIETKLGIWIRDLMIN